MTGLPDPELSRAVLIGAGRFSGLPNLPAVHHNLADLKTALTDPKTGILPGDRCTVVDDPRSTAVFMRQLRSAAAAAEDFFLVYYAGHGLRDQVHNDRLYLAVRETDMDGPDGTAVLFESVRDVIEQSRARTRVLILDCCYSGLALGVMSGDVIEAHEIGVGGTAVMTSSPSNQRSLALPGQRYTAFTGELITLLRQGSPVHGEQLTVNTAFRSLQAALTAKHLPRPKLKLTDTGSDILLRRPTPEPPPQPPIWRPPPPPRRPAPAEPITIPKIPPVPEPGPGRPSIARTMAVDFGWFAVRVGVAIGIALMVGGFGNAIFSDEGASSGIVGSCFVVACGIPAVFRHAQGRSSPRLSELSQGLAKARPPLLITALVVSGLCTLAGALGSSQTNPPTYSAVTNVTMICLLTEATLACAYALWRGRRTGTAPVVGDVPVLR